MQYICFTKLSTYVCKYKSEEKNHANAKAYCPIQSGENYDNFLKAW